MSLKVIMLTQLGEGTILLDLVTS